MYTSRMALFAIIVAVRVESVERSPRWRQSRPTYLSRPSHRFRGAATVVEPALREKNPTEPFFLSSIMVGRVLWTSDRGFRDRPSAEQSIVRLLRDFHDPSFSRFSTFLFSLFDPPFPRIVTWKKKKNLSRTQAFVTAVLENNYRRTGNSLSRLALSKLLVFFFLV